MDIIILDTGELAELNLTGPHTARDSAMDFIEQYGGFSSNEFEFNALEERFSCDMPAFERWKAIIDAQSLLDTRINKLSRLHGASHVEKVVRRAVSIEIDEAADAVHDELDKVFGEDSELPF